MAEQPKSVDFSVVEDLLTQLGLSAKNIPADSRIVIEANAVTVTVRVPIYRHGSHA